MDNQYWNHFYLNSSLTMEPSLFAKFVMRYIEHGNSLIELGCGNGRDSVFFESQGVNVTAVDMSSVAIKKLTQMNINGLTIIQENFVELISNYNDYFDHAYSRFTLHSLVAEDQSYLLKRVHCALKKKGKLFIETRSIRDEKFGLGEDVGDNAFIYDGHYRRFLSKSDLEKEILEHGYKIVFSDEKRDFAPYKNENPYVIRIICQKEE